MTFSIVAYDPDTQAVGVAVASKFLAVGALVSWAEAGTGAVATQALAKVGFGPQGLALLRSGVRAQDALAQMLEMDSGRDDRQVGIVGTNGDAAAHTGSRCFDWAGHHVGEGFTCQGNILVSAAPIQAMAEAYRTVSGPLERRLLAALVAGDHAGGDRRGRQSAALIVFKPNGGYGGDTDRYLDLRVDDDPDPVTRLSGLVDTHHLFFGAPVPEDRLEITADIARELQAMLSAGGYLQREATGVWDDASKAAFWALVGNENLEERWNIERDPDGIDRVALEYLRRRFNLE